MSELAVRRLVVERDGVRALHGVDLDIQAGELVAVMGGTGAGKSTLALALCGLVAPASGSISGDGIGAARLVLQRPEATFLTDEVRDEVALAAVARGEPRTTAERHAAELLAELGLPAGIADRDPLALSGGEQRRVAIAAVLAADPRVLVLDEPGAGLDRTARQELHDALRRSHAAGRTIVLVTHDPDEAAMLATRLVVLRDGAVVWNGGAEPVLGQPDRAHELGLAATPEVEVLHDVARALGAPLAAPVATAEGAVDALAALLAAAPRHVSRTASGMRTGLDSHDRGGLAERGVPALPALPPLPPLVDARVRLVACALAVAATLLATSLLVAALVAVVAAVVVAIARIGRARVRLAVRPLVALAALLVALALLVGGTSDVVIAPGIETTHPAAAAILRALQATGVVLATLALSGATAVGDLATAMRRLLAPLRAVRVPVGSLAFVVATGLGLVPAFADELERLRLAQRARGIRPARVGWLAGLRLDAALMAPLFVAAFRRAHLLADALVVRGIDPATSPPDWRVRRTPSGDIVLLLVAVALIVVARFV